MTPTFLGVGKEHRGIVLRNVCWMMRLEYFELEVPLAHSSLKCRREVDAE